VKQEWSFFLPKFSILGLNNEVLLKIHGPFLPLKCCGDINFEVTFISGNAAARILFFLLKHVKVFCFLRTNACFTQLRSVFR